MKKFMALSLVGAFAVASLAFAAPAAKKTKPAAQPAAVKAMTTTKHGQTPAAKTSKKGTKKVQGQKGTTQNTQTK